MEEILEGILDAIEDEVQAQKSYQELADKAEDPKVRNFFLQLKLDEENHEKELRSRYKAFKKLLDSQKN